VESSELAICMLHALEEVGEPHNAESLISVISEHFLVGTQQAEHDAEEIVAKFRNCFGDVTYLAPLGFSSSNGDDVTDRMH